MADGCCPQLKVIQASIVRHNVKQKNENGCCSSTNYQNENENIKENLLKLCQQSTNDSEAFQDRVSNLQGKLAEATANIALLRSWVGEAGEVIKDVGPKTPKQFIAEINDLIVKLSEMEALSVAFAERSQQCMDLMEFIENQSCICALTSPSCEAIKTELEEILTEKENIDNTIESLNKNGVSKKMSLNSANKVVDSIIETIDGVLACTNSTCPNLSESDRQGIRPKTVMSTGSQSKYVDPKYKPKVQQTVTRPKSSQGTDPCNNPSCPSRPKTPNRCC